MPRILVTGATGLVGRQLLPQLALAGYDVHAWLNQRETPENLRPVATWHTGDMLNPDAIEAVLEDAAPSLLMHLAWPGTTGSLSSEVHREFLTASKQLIHGFYQRGGDRAVVAGTCFEYDWSDGICSEDTTAILPRSEYGRCKNALREFTQATANAVGRSWAWGRIFFVYGPHQDPTRFVPTVIQGLLDGQPVLCTEGRQVRDYLHVYDVAGGLVHLLESGFCGECNIGSGEAVSLRDIAIELSRMLGGRSLLQFGAKPTPKDEPALILADINRLRHHLKWQPRFTLGYGLADTVASYRNAARASAVL
jgi:nucleoside-diphosphate-sugar epimerase